MKLTRRGLFGTLIAPLLAKFWTASAQDLRVVSGVTVWRRELTDDEFHALATGIDPRMIAPDALLKFTPST